MYALICLSCFDNGNIHELISTKDVLSYVNEIIINGESEVNQELALSFVMNLLVVSDRPMTDRILD